MPGDPEHCPFICAFCIPYAGSFTPARCAASNLVRISLPATDIMSVLVLNVTLGDTNLTSPPLIASCAFLSVISDIAHALCVSASLPTSIISPTLNFSC